MRSSGMAMVGAAFLVGLALPGRALAVGPSPGTILGSPGASWQGHSQRFEAAPGGLGTRITEMTAGGAAIRSVSVRGQFGIPEVAYDGSTEQLPARSSSLVLAPWNAPASPATPNSSSSRRAICACGPASRSPASLRSTPSRPTARRST